MKIHVTQTLRPIRLAFFIQRNKKHSYLRAIRICSFLWGGRYFPIFPVYKKFTREFRAEYQLIETPLDFYSNSIKNFDPDYIVIDDNLDTAFRLN